MYIYGLNRNNTVFFTLSPRSTHDHAINTRRGAPAALWQLRLLTISQYSDKHVVERLALDRATSKKVGSKSCHCCRRCRHRSHRPRCRKRPPFSSESSLHNGALADTLAIPISFVGRTRDRHQQKEPEPAGSADPALNWWPKKSTAVPYLLQIR